MTTYCKCQTPVTETKPVWREGKVVKLCSSCVQRTKLGKTRLAKESHLEAWLKTQPAPIVKQKALEDMSVEELEAEIARLSA